MRHIVFLAATALVAVVMWYAWTGFRIDGLVHWKGLPSLLRGTWAFDLRYPLIPVYAVFGLWVVERLTGLIRGTKPH